MKRKGMYLVSAFIFGILLLIGNFPAIGLKTSEVQATEMGQAIMYEKYMTVTTDNGIKVWGDFKGTAWTQKNTAKNLYQKTYWANAYYVHPTTKVKYYSLFEKEKGGKWVGYITQKAVTEAADAGGVAQADGRQFTVAKGGVTLYSNLGTLAKKGTTSTILARVVTSKAQYNHANGKTYLSLVDHAGKSLGMIEGTSALKTKQALTVKYQTHVQNDGWQTWKADGAIAGTTGKAKRLEGIHIQLDHLPVAGGIEYRTHIQNVGWETSYKKNGEQSGTSGQSKRLEAIQIRLTGELAQQYDIYYRVHAQNFGWLGWAKNDAQSGTAGFAYRLEGIQIELVKKGGAAPGSTANAFKKGHRVTVNHQGEDGKILKTETTRVLSGTSYTAKVKSFTGYKLRGASSQSVTVNGTKTITFSYRLVAPDVQYTTHVQNLGWQPLVTNGAVSGTTGKSLRVEALKVSLGSAKVTGGIETSSHVQNIGWQDYVTAGKVSGTSGQSKQVEAIQVRLTGEVAKYFDVYYRVYAQNFGWLGWAKNGTSAGSQGYSYRVESLQIQLVHKGDAAPGNTSNSFKVKPKTYKVTVVHKGSDGATLETEKAVAIEKGQKFTAKAKTFKGYTVSGATSQTITVNGNTTITFNYTKDGTVVDKTALQTLYNSVKGLTKGNYTDATWSTFTTARANALSVLNDSKATQQQVDDAKTSLQNAKDGLKENIQKFAVTVVHVGPDGKTLESESAVQVENGKSFTANAKTFRGYKVNGESSKTITVTKDTTVVFKYVIDESTMPTIAEAEAKVTQGLFNAINGYRQENGLATLGQHDIAMQASATRAVEIFTVFDHVRPDGSSYNTALKELGFSGISGENIGIMTGSDLNTIMQTGYQNAIQAWKDSPAHNSYMLATGVKKMGIGIHIEQTNGYYKIGFVMIGISYDFNEPASANATSPSLTQESSEPTVESTEQSVQTTTETTEPTVETEQTVESTEQVTEPTASSEAVEVAPVSANIGNGD